ncbi:isopentenyl-diphosphate Delta-isomerase [soil metagenome]
MEQVILVDDQDQEIGRMEKIEAHRKGLLHRAFSILLFNSQGEVLLQKRAKSKYHSGGLWTNTCCSHPLPDESIEDAARRKLIQEMGIDLTPEFAFKFHYKADLDMGLVEHELDHVLIGRYDGEPVINPIEAEDWEFVPIDRVYADMESSSDKYTTWFKLILEHPEFGRIEVI